MNRVASYQNLPLNILSWNISNAHPSFSAPDKLQRSQDAPRLIREECLRYTPDIIALQECPYPSFGSDEFTNYVSVGTRQSHCGFVDLLIRNELQNVQPITLPKHLPSVATTIALPNETKITVSSSHLAPFKEGADQRLMQCMTLLDCMYTESPNCILLGDMNMRVAEDVNIENAGLIDAWKSAGANSDSKFSWNTFTNKYHEGCYQYRARYDRCYIRGDVFSVREFGLIGNHPVENRSGDYLSDHFGLSIRLDVTKELHSSAQTQNNIK